MKIYSKIQVSMYVILTLLLMTSFACVSSPRSYATFKSITTTHVYRTSSVAATRGSTFWFVKQDRYRHDASQSTLCLMYLD